MKIDQESYTFDDFVTIIRELRSEHGCPWDREQTHESLKNCMLEECYEAIDAINKGDIDNLREELGDVLLQVALHTVIAEEKQEFTMNDVTTEVSKKMILRHPHVFGDVVAKDSKDVLNNWEVIKAKEKKEESVTDSMLRVANALPALIRAEKIQKKAAKVCEIEQSTEELVQIMRSVLDNIDTSTSIGNRTQMEEQIGEMLFRITDLSRKIGINAENSLTNATDKFINRFKGVEQLAEGEGKHLKDMSIEERTALWGRII